MLFEIKEPGPGFDYFLNTSCNDWDVVQYHAFWKKSNFGLNKASIMRRFNTQLQKIKEQSTEEEKNNAIRLKKQFQSNCYNDSDVGHGNDNNPFIAQTGGVQRNISHAIDNVVINNVFKNDWIIPDGYNISTDFRKLQVESIEKLKTDLILSYAKEIDMIL
uniref:Uncharacterized protein n=1 Tax=Rhizophagus irregularis (strain DAOM 181602 / DAOM 197198 / MUCL 43194) TaxID=747089 RepID=U9SKX0_RHIID